ncbi:uncharacterized protein LOC129720855 [Wyeomyia smithii]|uniref:uncharacterized protein LOC129720855 n=1 Tax=Wyeomyia smithii TaxID=174621 RepID=UPI0024680BA6|nr:uncharacterized protein LOC129720855 [Wyeomyia smithii]XP_055528671.1 uncharacterized protein LOC129720855 [Wyeomyia smithii]XP_055528672.1 uncharacterized protein LOC129720855 [Wyeomyia smithii]
MEPGVPTFNILQDMRRLGCSRETHCATAYRLYLHLCEERCLWDVQYHYSQELDVIYLTARKQKDPSSATDIYIPMASFEDLPMDDVERYQMVLGESNKEVSCPSSIVFGFCDPSSTVLLYRMTNTIKPLTEKPLSRNKRNKEMEPEAHCSRSKVV